MVRKSNELHFDRISIDLFYDQFKKILLNTIGLRINMVIVYPRLRLTRLEMQKNKLSNHVRRPIFALKFYTYSE